MGHRTTDRSVRHVFAGLIAALGLVLLAVACGSGDSAAPTPDEAPAEAPAAAQTEEPAAPAATPTGDTGDAILADDVVPEGFPTDIPIYPGATPGASMVVPGDGLFATFESDDDVQAILDHYRSGFEENGWSIDGETDDGLTATKDARSVQIKARASETGTTEIAVNLSEG